MESATEYQLKLVRWQFFVTATWSTSMLGSIRSRETQLWQYIRDWATREGCKLAQLPIALRWERGEHGDRPHAHFLIAGFRERSVNQNTCWRQWRLWHSQFGLGKVTMYDPFRQGNPQAYISKLRADRGRAMAYEIGKYDHADRLVINDAAMQEMCRVSGVKEFTPYRTA